MPLVDTTTPNTAPTFTMPPFADEPSNWVHHSAWVEDNVKIHYVRCSPSNPNGRTLVLLHGYPSTW